MKFAASFAIVGALVASVSCAPFRRDVDESLIPQFGLYADVNPTGTGDCDGITNAAGVVVKIPCFCPPDRASFIQSLNANVAVGHAVNNTPIAVSFPSDNSQASQLARINAALVTLQNLRGPGVGCPAASTTFVAQQQAIQAGTTVATTTAAASSTTTVAASSGSTSTGGINDALVPQFGVTADVNPTGTGDCDGITNAAGVVVKIPCTCPPDRTVFLNSLAANVAAGHAVNNPTVAVTFPEDSSTASQISRIQASIITLQNLNGPGVGCPAASTTFSAQLKALTG